MTPAGNPWVCNTCNNSYADEKSLLRHERDEPTKCGRGRLVREKGTHFKCGECAEDFRFARKLEEHILRVHLPLLAGGEDCGQLGERRVCCRVCSETFSSEARVRGHMEQEHSPVVVLERINIQYP